jgi:H+/Cl- antiporter ClcA/CBS domain-containing protein
MEPALQAAHMDLRTRPVDKRTFFIAGLSILVAFAAAFVAQGLTRLIGLITNLAFYQRWSSDFSSPADNHLGVMVIGVPVIGGLIVGVMARFGSKAIRGHGIPEAMEQVLTNQSRIPARLTFLKPLSAAIAIGTGGPFGAEGPIIATGGAMGSVLGQMLSTTAVERKTLLAAGAAAGMAATFGSPVSAVLLAVELLLFEFKARSLVPVALAAATAASVRIAFVGSAPIFPMHDVTAPSGAALAAYVGIGLIVGVFSVGVTKLVYVVEDYFEKLPIHWMWWPAIGAVAVGVVGYFAPLTLGVGYSNIEHIVGGDVLGRALVALVVLKFVSWSVSLGSGTSGGTLAPLFTIGGGLGALIASFIPGLSPGIGGLVGMAAMFAGASRALLASVVFAFETTRQPLGLLPLLGGCTAAYLVSSLLMRNTIMTEKIERRGVRVIGEYSADFLEQTFVRDFARSPVTTLAAADLMAQVRNWLDSGASGTSHQGYPVVGDGGALIGVLTRRDLLAASLEARVGDLIRRAPISIDGSASLRDAADMMTRNRVGRLPVLRDGKLHGILTRSDLLSAHERRLDETRREEPSLRITGVGTGTTRNS